MIKNGVFGKEIVYKDKEQVKHGPFLGTGCLFICIVGGTGVGKSRILLQLIPNFSKSTKNIILCSLVQDNDIHDTIGKYCNGEKINYIKCIDVPTAEKAIEEVIENEGKEGHKLIILDDFTNLKKGDDEYNIFANKCFSLLRNYNCSVIYITQSYSSIPTKTRTNISIRIVGQCDNIYAVRGIEQDTSNLFYELPFTLMDLYRDMLDDKHKFLFIRTYPPEIGKISNEYDKDGKLIKQHYNKLHPPGKLHAGGNMTIGQERGLTQKAKLFKIAKQYGFEQDRFKLTTIPELRKFIKQKSAEGELTAGNTADEIKDLLQKTKIGYKKHHLYFYIQKWLKTNDNKYIDNIIDIAEHLLKSGEMSPEFWTKKLNDTGLCQLIEYK